MDFVTFYCQKSAKVCNVLLFHENNSIFYIKYIKSLHNKVLVEG